MPTIQIGQHTVEYRVERSARHRQIRLVVTPKRSVYVAATIFDSDAVITQFVEQSRDWLRKQLYPSEPPEAPVHVVEDEHGPIRFRVTRNPRRKRVSVYWASKTGLEVRAPTAMPMAQIEECVLQNAAAIRGRTREMAAEAPPERRWVSGETVSLQGQELALEIVPHTATGRAKRQGDKLVVKVAQAAPPGDVPHIVRDEVVRFLTKQAAAEVDRRLPELAARIGVRPGRITIKDTKSRHGSCSADGNISIAFRVVMAPPEVMDYILIHELCHIRHPNHSREFWALVAQMMPGYERHKQWLKDNAATLRL